MSTEVNFRLAGGVQPLILLPAHVNDAGPYQFILDTGAGVSVLSPDLARRLAVVVTETREGMGAGGRVKISLGSVESLTVGRYKMRGVQVGMTDDLDRIAAAVGAKVDGVLGYNFLKHFRLTIDYRKSALRLSQTAGEPEEGGHARAQIKFRLAHPSKPLVLVPALVNGEGPYQFALDTGASTTVVSTELARSSGIEGAHGPAITGGGGQTAASFGSIKSLAVGMAEQRDLPVAVVGFLGALGQAVTANLDGIIGYNYLKAFRVSIDYPNETLSLETPAG